PIERVTTASAQALALLDEVTRALGASKLPAAEWDSLARIRQLLDYLRQAQRLVGHGNLELSDPASARSKQFAETAQRVSKAEVDLLAAQRKTVAWRQKLSPTDL